LIIFDHKRNREGYWRRTALLESTPISEKNRNTMPLLIA